MTNLLSEKVAVSLKNVWVRYGKRVVLESIDLDILQEEIISIVGPNGSGKTTLLHTILGLKKPFLGDVVISKDMIDCSGHRIPIGYLPQRGALESRFPISVFDVVAFSIYSQKGLFSGLNHEDENMIQEALDCMEMARYKHDHFGSLSGGQKQRVLIARALALGPKLLVLDEPSTGLDIVSQDRFYALLERLRNEKNLTIIIVSHDIGAVSSVVDRVACLNRRIHYHGKPTDSIPSEALQQVFGEHVQFVFHSHHCQTCEKTKC
jgi:zinc transport system ATP-binding protein